MSTLATRAACERILRIAGTGGDEEHIVTEFLDLSRISLLIFSQTLIDDGVEFRFLEGLGEVILRAQAHRLHNFASIADAGQHHDLDAGTHLAKLLECFQAIDARHQHVKQHHVGGKALFDALQSFFTGGSSFHLIVVDFKQGPDVPKHSRFIVDQQNVGRFAHFVFPLVVLLEGGFHRNEERKFAARSGFAFHPDLTAHGVYQTASDSQAEAHAFGLTLATRQAEKIVKDFHVIFRRNPRSRIGDADFHGVWRRQRLAAPFALDARFAGATAVPHVRFRVQPDRSTCRRELRCIFEQIGNHALNFWGVKREAGPLFHWPKNTKPNRSAGNGATRDGILPTDTRLCRRLVLHSQFAGFKNGVRQKVLNEILQSLSAGVHVTDDVALPLIERAELFRCSSSM